jgi:hypothetical protein
MGEPPDHVRRFYDARTDRFGEPYRHVGDGKEFAALPRPDAYVAVPPAVLEACGFYFLNVLKRDNGSVYVFQADAAPASAARRIVRRAARARAGPFVRVAAWPRLRTKAVWPCVPGFFRRRYP